MTGSLGTFENVTFSLLSLRFKMVAILQTKTKSKFGGGGVWWGGS